MTATTQTIEISDVRNGLDELLDRVNRGETRVLVEKSGIPLAMIVSPAEWKQFQESERRRQDPFAILDEMGEVFKDVSPDEIEREAEKAVAEVRAEMRAERLAAAAAADE